jgi:hypothetical protein
VGAANVSPALSQRFILACLGVSSCSCCRLVIPSFHPRSHNVGSLNTPRDRLPKHHPRTRGRGSWRASPARSVSVSSTRAGAWDRRHRSGSRRPRFIHALVGVGPPGWPPPRRSSFHPRAGAWGRRADRNCARLRFIHACVHVGSRPSGQRSVGAFHPRARGRGRWRPSQVRCE